MAITDQVPTPRAGGGLAIASLLTGIAAVFACGIGIVAGPVAVVLGVLAGKKGGFGARAVAGIITGSLGFVIWAGALVWLLLYASDDDDRTITTPTPVPVTAQAESDAADEGASGEASAEPPTGLVLTEEGVAAAGFPTAYAAFLETYGVSASFDGMYAGDPIDTPCFTMDGEAWWVTQGEPSLCQPSSELWRETIDDNEIKLFGTGGVGARISFEPFSSDAVTATVGASDLASVAAYAKETLLVPAGATNIVESQTTLDGAPAVRFDCTFPGMASYQLYVVVAPQVYPVADYTVSGFVIHAYNELGWVYPSEDVSARLEETLQWK